MTRLIDPIRRQGKLCLLLLPLIWLVACAPPQQDAHKRFFWPPGFTAPKIEYINFYHAEEDLSRDVDGWLDEAVFGKKRPTMVFARPGAIASDGKGRVFVVDQGLGNVLVWDFTKHQLRFLRTGGGSNYPFELAAGIAVDDAGRVYVTESLRKEVLVFNAAEKFVGRIEGHDLQRPTGLAFDENNQKLYVVDTGNHEVLRFSAEGRFETRFGKRGVEDGEFNYPLDAAVDAQGRLYVLDSMNARVQVFDPEGKFLNKFGERGSALGSFQIPKAISVGPSGHVYVTDSQAHRFVVFGLDGSYLTTVGGASPVLDGKVKPGGFYLPEGIDVDASGQIWVSDSLNRMFHRFQYLTEEYLKKHPIDPGEAFMPSGVGATQEKQ